ncbi:MAG: hypothetical protein PUC93_04850 [Oscillospiraceae bacterium]|nr:hypothetical protein [Oscillospiraceae bacterium]
MRNYDAIYHVYDPLLIGKRIEKERKALKKKKNGKERSMSQEDFVEEYGSKIGITTYKTLGKIESGNTNCELTIWQLLEFCKIFDCDMGYLLGEYDCHYRETTDICAATGLTENAVATIQHIKGLDKNGELLDIISRFLSSGMLYALAMQVCEYAKMERVHTKDISEISDEEYAAASEAAEAILHTPTRVISGNAFKNLLEFNITDETVYFVRKIAKEMLAEKGDNNNAEKA